MARSSSVSWARFSVASRAARRAQSRAQAASKDMVFPSRVLAGVGSGPDRHAPEGEGRPCGCDRALRGPDGSLRIPGTSVGRAGAGRRGAHRPLAFSSSHAPDDLARWDRKVAFDQHERTRFRRWHGGVRQRDTCMHRFRCDTSRPPTVAKPQEEEPPRGPGQVQPDLPDPARTHRVRCLRLPRAAPLGEHPGRGVQVHSLCSWPRATSIRSRGGASR